MNNTPGWLTDLVLQKSDFLDDVFPATDESGTPHPLAGQMIIVVDIANRVITVSNDNYDRLIAMAEAGEANRVANLIVGLPDES